MRARGTPPSVDDAVLAAVAASSLRHLRPAMVQRLLAGSTRRRLEAGTILRHEGEPGPHLELLVDGFVRILVGAPEGAR